MGLQRLQCLQRANPYFLFLTTRGSFEGSDIQAKQVSLFPVLPSISWNSRLTQPTMKSLFSLNPMIWRYRWRLLLGVAFIVLINVFAVWAPSMIGKA